MTYQQLLATRSIHHLVDDEKNYSPSSNEIYNIDNLITRRHYDYVTTSSVSSRAEDKRFTRARYKPNHTKMPMYLTLCNGTIYKYKDLNKIELKRLILTEAIVEIVHRNNKTSRNLLSVDNNSSQNIG